MAPCPSTFVSNVLLTNVTLYICQCHIIDIYSLYGVTFVAHIFVDVFVG
jgi:hypothetical protein